VVYAAFDDKLERKVALKLVAQRSDDRASHRPLREAQALARLSHPNVVTVYEVGALPDGGLFIAMELIKGHTLRAWQHGQPRTWREIVAMYADAGRGLAAAHRTGIVHRDFKPDNVLVGEDGRVRVVDFGLASADHAPLAPPTSRAGVLDGGEPRGGDPRDVANLCDASTIDAPPDADPALANTRSVSVAGTPGYIAPEHLSGAPADARADQYSFCVALYEALHGERPGRALGAPARGSAPEPSYPRWLGELLQRGLAPSPLARFATMDALVVELTRSRERIRRRALTAAVVGGLVTAGVATAMSRAAREPPPCPLAVGELAGVWDPAVRLRGRAAILGTGAAFASAAWASTETAFDHYAERWLGAQQEACAATWVRHAQSAVLLDQRMECLAARRRSLAAATEVLQARPAQAVAHAGELLGSLGDLELCADTRALLVVGPGAAIAGRRDPALHAKLATIREHLARADALLATGDTAGAGPLVTRAAALATDLDGDPVQAELAYFEARIQSRTGDMANAIRTANRAIALAVASHHDELQPDIWLMLAVRGGAVDQRADEIETWLSQGEAWLSRLAHPVDSRRIHAEHARGKLELTTAQPRAAVTTLSHGIAAAEALWGPSDPRLLHLLTDRAVAEGQLHDAKAAIADGERALAIGLAAWGADHPDIAQVRRALGLLYIEQLGDVARGEHELTLAVALYRTQLGDDSIEVANCEQALSQAAQYRGDYAAVLAHAERAEQIYARRLGAEHPRRGEALLGVGAARFMRKDFAGSLDAYEAAYPILRAALGDAHTTVGLLLSNTGETLLALRRAGAAQADFERALAILERKLGPDDVSLAFPLKGLGLAHLQRGRPGTAIAPLERALTLRTSSPAASDPQELAEIRWGLARALRALGRDPERARSLARSAATAYSGLGPESAARAQEIQHWIITSRSR